MRPQGELYFSTGERDVSLSCSVSQVLVNLRITTPVGFYYESHYPCIGGFNEILCPQFTREWMMQRLGWKSENMF